MLLLFKLITWVLLPSVCFSGNTSKIFSQYVRISCWIRMQIKLFLLYGQHRYSYSWHVWIQYYTIILLNKSCNGCNLFGKAPSPLPEAGSRRICLWLIACCSEVKGRLRLLNYNLNTTPTVMTSGPVLSSPLHYIITEHTGQQSWHSSHQ